MLYFTKLLKSNPNYIHLIMNSLGLDLDPRMLSYISENVKSSLPPHDQTRFQTLNENFSNIDKINLYKIFEEEFP